MVSAVDLGKQLVEQMSNDPETAAKVAQGRAGAER